jgi:hypothetical protein
MTYNLTGISTNSTGLVSFMVGVNDNIMGGFLGIIMLLVVFAITFVTLMLWTEETGKALVAASFFIWALSMLFVGVGLVPPITFGVSLFVLVGSAVVAKYRS